MQGVEEVSDAAEAAFARFGYVPAFYRKNLPVLDDSEVSMSNKAAQKWTPPAGGGYVPKRASKESLESEKAQVSISGVIPPPKKLAEKPVPRERALQAAQQEMAVRQVRQDKNMQEMEKNMREMELIIAVRHSACFLYSYSVRECSDVTVHDN
jgi:hypothetical protein